MRGHPRLPRPTSRAAWRVALVAALLPAPLPLAHAGAPRPPAFSPALAPLVGTWRHVREVEGNRVELWLVIKEERGQLRLRYQLPARDKVYTSDWNAQMEIGIQVNVSEKRRTTLQVQTAPPAILTREEIRYSGSDDSYRAEFEGAFELDGKGGLLYRCRALRQGKKAVPCPAPLRYERVSDDTRWPD